MFQASGGEPLDKEIHDFIRTNIGVHANVIDSVKVHQDTVHFNVTTLEQTTELLANKYKLRNYRYGSVSLTPSTSPLEWEVQNRLAAVASDEKRKGNQVSVGYMRMRINNEPYLWDHEQNELVKVTYHDYQAGAERGWFARDRVQKL